MSGEKDSHAGSERKVTMRSVVVFAVIGIVMLTVVLYLRVTQWDTTLKTHPILIPALSIVLMALFYPSILISVAYWRETRRAVSGWIDVIGLMILEGILTYLIFGDLLYVSLVILICLGFVVYLHFAQG